MKCIKINSCLECPNIVINDIAADFNYCNLDDSIWIKEDFSFPDKCPLQEYTEGSEIEEKILYYVFSASWEEPNRTGHGDFWMDGDSYPSKSNLKKIVAEYNTGAFNVVIFGITEMTKTEFDKYWGAI